MNKPRLCVDIDNVIAQTDEVMRRVIHDYTKGRVNLEYEDVVRFEYHECTDKNGQSISEPDWKVVHEWFSRRENLLSIRPYPGVEGHLGRLAERFDLHFVTTRLGPARQCTVEWLGEHRFPTHYLHFVKHREKHVPLGQFAAAIEDDRIQAEAFQDIGTRAILLEHPWNGPPPDSRLQTMIPRLRDWSQITGYVLESCL